MLLVYFLFNPNYFFIITDGEFAGCNVLFIGSSSVRSCVLESIEVTELEKDVITECQSCYVDVEVG